MHRCSVLVLICCLVSFALITNPAHAADIGLYFQWSGELIEMPYPGTEFYGEVALTHVSLNNLLIDINAYTSPQEYDFLGNLVTSPLVAGSNFGIDKFGMNSTLINSEADFDAFVGLYDVSMPDDWGCKWGGVAGEFGKFEFWYTGTGNSRVDPLAISITPKTGAVIPVEYQITSASDFVEMCPQGYYFSMHAAGFTTDPSYWQSGHSDVESSFLGVSTESYVIQPPIPEPSMVVLVVAALAAMTLRKRRPR
jgi:hypothetical protein